TVNRAGRRRVMRDSASHLVLYVHGVGLRCIERLLYHTRCVEERERAVDREPFVSDRRAYDAFAGRVESARVGIIKVIEGAPESPTKANSSEPPFAEPTTHETPPSGSVFTVVVSAIVMVSIVVPARLNIVRDEAVGFARVTHETRLDLGEADWWSN